MEGGLVRQREKAVAPYEAFGLPARSDLVNDNNG